MVLHRIVSYDWKRRVSVESALGSAFAVGRRARTLFCLRVDVSREGTHTSCVGPTRLERGPPGLRGTHPSCGGGGDPWRKNREEIEYN